MKKKFLIGAAFIAVLSLSAFTGVKMHEIKNSSAEVDMIEGYYIFVDAKPIKEFEYLGTVSTGGISFGDSQYTGVRDRLIKKAKKDYPKADALIFSFHSGEKDKVDAIRFK